MPQSLLSKVAFLAVFAAVSVFSSALALAEDPVGKWQGVLETRRGANEVTLEFSKGEAGLEGTWTGPRGTSDLEDVEQEGSELTFVRNLEMRGNEFTINFTAAIDGDTMSVTMETPRGSNQFTLNRVE